MPEMIWLTMYLLVRVNYVGNLVANYLSTMLHNNSHNTRAEPDNCPMPFQFITMPNEIWLDTWVIQATSDQEI